MSEDTSFARYARQVSLPEIGPAGQAKLAAARVLVVGLGGLGSPAALYLAAVGIGTLGIMDGDAVDLGNLQRQILYATSDVGRPKARAAADRLRALNPLVTLVPRGIFLDEENARPTVRGYSFVLDATDSFAAKDRIARACHAEGVAYSHAGILAFHGHALTVLPGRSACPRCVFRDPPPPPADGPPRGPLGPVPGILGAVQALEAVKHVTGAGTLLTDRLFTFDGLALRSRVVPITRDPACPVCGPQAAG